MKQFSLMAALILAVSFFSGAEAKEYRASERPGAAGYFNLVEDGFWIVGYTGEAGQSEREVGEYALKRAADLTAEQNQEWFAVLSATNRQVQLGVADDLQTRAGSFMGGGSTANTQAAPSGAPPASSSGASGSFGGEAVPNAVIERWQPRRVRQTILVVEMRSGTDTSFPGLQQEPQLHPATGRTEVPPLQ